MHPRILVIFRGNKDKIDGVKAYFTPLLSRLRNKGYDIDEYYQKEYRSKLISFLRMTLYYPIATYFKSKQYDFVIISNDLLCNHALFCTKKSILVFHHVRNESESTLEYGKKTLTDVVLYFYRTLMYKIAFKCKSIVAPSNNALEDIKALYPQYTGELKTIYNAFDLNEFNNTEANINSLNNKYQINLNKNKKILLYVGTELNRKNFKTLLDVLKKLPKQEYQLLKVGEPRNKKNREYHRNIVVKNNLDVIFVENVDKVDMPKLFSLAYCYLNPVLHEGFGRTPVEAQACSIPVISTHNGALKEVLGTSALKVEDAHNTDAYINHILSLEDASLRKHLIRKGKENAKRFDINQQVDDWDKLLSGLHNVKTLLLNRNIKKAS